MTTPALKRVEALCAQLGGEGCWEVMDECSHDGTHFFVTVRVTRPKGTTHVRVQAPHRLVAHELALAAIERLAALAVRTGGSDAS